MDENIYLGGEGQELAEPETVESGENQEVAEPGIEERESEINADELDTKHNADRAFARMRREIEERTRNEESLKMQNERLSKAIETFGFKGNTADDIADAIEAHTSGRTIEEIRSAREAKAKEDADIQRLREENAAFRQREAQRVFDEDLKTIQKYDPKIKSLGELGEEFFKLRANGISTEVAYSVIKSKRDSEKIIPPPVMGRVNAQTRVERDFYTSDELDKLNSELDDPKVLEKAIRSMTKLK